MMFRTLFSLVVAALTLTGTMAQHYPGNDFIPPLDVPLKLSGTFGELRANHFHSGIDLKTGEMEGLKVFAVADGYVSRIKVQSGGYGKALYITHPNGYVSVYAHLSKYASPVDDYVVRSQYEKQSYEIDIYPPPGLFPVTQGLVVAYSGNSGRSGGPHLHFEIRGEADQKPVNPLQFNFDVTDKNPPVINLVKIYPYGKYSRVAGSGTPGDYFPVLNGSKYTLKGTDTITASGKLLFGINTYDPFNGGLNKNGVYAIRLFVNGELVYGHKLESFSFDETRYINSLIDYREYKTKSRRVQKSFVEPNNRLSIYTTRNNDGLEVNAGERYLVRYEVTDFAGNLSTVEFWIKGTAGPELMAEDREKEKDPLFTWARNNTFRTGQIELTVPGSALYDTMTFHFEQSDARAGMLSPVYRLHNDQTPLHSWCQLSIQAGELEGSLAPKALVVKLEPDGELSPWGGTWEKGRISTRIREFGDYCIMADTVPPVIKPLNIHAGKSLLAQNTIQVRITDELSGIASYNGYLDGSWILMEYDEKNDLLTYHFDHNLKDGENAFELTVTDERGNRANYKATLLY